MAMGVGPGAIFSAAMWATPRLSTGRFAAEASKSISTSGSSVAIETTTFEGSRIVPSDSTSITGASSASVVWNLPGNIGVGLTGGGACSASCSDLTVCCCMT